MKNLIIISIDEIFQGPGLFIIVPCVDAYTKVDLRTVTFDVPPQEVRITVLSSLDEQEERKKERNPSFH